MSALLVLLAAAAPAYILSPAGNDSAACTLQMPCATLARAQTLMRATSTKTTYLFSGTFTLAAPLVLNARDNGETIGAYPGASPRLVPGSLQFSTPISIDGASAVTITGLALSNTRAASSDGGDCIQINGGTANILRQNHIGPCLGHGVHITGGRGHKVLDSYIHTEHHPTAATCCDVNEGVRVEGNAANILIAGNVIAFNESNVELMDTNRVVVDGNFLLNPLGPFPRGQNFQSGSSTNVKVTRNYALSSRDPKYPFAADQEDSINFYTTTNPLAQANTISGGVSPSGCAIIADDHTSGAHFLSNTIYNSGECGIAIAAGHNQVVSNNRVLNLDPVRGGGNVGIYVANYAAPYPCNTIAISNNVASAIASPCDPATQTCAYNSYNQDSSCTQITATGNIFDFDDIGPGGGAAYRKLINTVPQSAPLIPPIPYACTINTPYTTQTSKSPC